MCLALCLCLGLSLDVHGGAIAVLEGAADTHTSIPWSPMLGELIQEISTTTVRFASIGHSNLAYAWRKTAFARKVGTVAIKHTLVASGGMAAASGRAAFAVVRTSSVWTYTTTCSAVVAVHIALDAALDTTRDWSVHAGQVAYSVARTIWKVVDGFWASVTHFADALIVGSCTVGCGTSLVILTCCGCFTFHTVAHALVGKLRRQVRVRVYTGAKPVVKKRRQFE